MLLFLDNSAIMSLPDSATSPGMMLQAGAVLLGAIWILGEARLLLPGETVRTLGGLAMAVFLIPAILYGRRATQALTLALLATALALTHFYGAWSALWGGLERAVLLVGLLLTLSLLRIALQDNQKVEAYRRRVEAQPAAERSVWILSGSYVTASLLSVGAISVFASLLPPDSSKDKRVRYARISVCGASLAILWSPFFFALAFVTEFLPGIALTALIATGFALSMAGMAIALAIVGEGTEGPRAATRALASLGEFAIPIAVVTALLVGVRALTGFSTIETMLTVLPALCVLLIAMPPSGRLQRLGSDIWGRLCRMQDEAAIVGSATVFGTVLTAAPWLQDVISPGFLAAIPGPLLILGCITFMAGAGLLGLLPLVTGTISLVVLTTFPNALSDLAVGLSVLAGWSLASMASMSSMMVLVAAAQYNIRPEWVMAGPDWRFYLVFVPIAGSLISLAAIFA